MGTILGFIDVEALIESCFVMFLFFAIAIVAGICEVIEEEWKECKERKEIDNLIEKGGKNDRKNI